MCGDRTPWNTTSELSVGSLPGDAIVLVKRLWAGCGDGVRAGAGGIFGKSSQLRLGAPAATAAALLAVTRFASILAALAALAALVALSAITFAVQISRTINKSSGEAFTTHPE
jgi:hypothetical protein